MTIDEALELADDWAADVRITETMGGWRVVCKTLADEVRGLRAECLRLHHAEAEAMAVVLSLESTVERLR